jgi:hypothetical protein
VVDRDEEDPAVAPPPPPPTEDLQLKKAIEVLTSGIEQARKTGTRAATGPGAAGRNPEPATTPVTPLNVPKPPR